MREWLRLINIAASATETPSRVSRGVIPKLSEIMMRSSIVPTPPNRAKHTKVRGSIGTARIRCSMILLTSGGVNIGAGVSDRVDRRRYSSVKSGLPPARPRIRSTKASSKSAPSTVRASSTDSVESRPSKWTLVHERLIVRNVCETDRSSTAVPVRIAPMKPSPSESMCSIEREIKCSVDSSSHCRSSTMKSAGRRASCDR